MKSATDTTPQLTREQLRAEMDRIEAARKAVEEKAAPIRAQLEPFEQQLSTLDEEMEELLDPHGDYLGRCESCDTPLLSGDKGFRYEDGPMFCADDSPTFGELLKDLRAYPADEWDEDSWGPLSEAIARLESDIASHGAETRCTDEL